MKDWFDNHPDLERLDYDDAVLDNRTYSIERKQTIWYVVDVTHDSFKVVSQSRGLSMGASYEWLLEMRHDYLADLRDNPPSTLQDGK